MSPSRQVQRAEFRAEMKRGAAIGKRKAREKKQVAREKRKAPASFLQQARTAVSVLKRPAQSARRLKAFSE